MADEDRLDEGPAEDEGADDVRADDVPAGAAPVDDEPGDDGPAGDEPADDEPAGDAPTGDRPAAGEQTDPIPADIVGHDVDGALAAAREAVGEGRVLLCVAYDDADFATVYVDERVDALYADEASREEHFGQIHSYVHLDFTERDLFEELYRQPDGVHAFVTYMGSFVAVRVVAESEGIFLGVAPGTPVTELVDAVEDVLRG